MAGDVAVQVFGKTTSNGTSPDPASTAPNAARNEDDDDDGNCVVCFERRVGSPLRPCGHHHFCDECKLRFRRCPLCRVPVTLTVNQGEAMESRTDNGQPPLLSSNEQQCLILLIIAVWLFICLGSYSEWSYDIPVGRSSSCLEKWEVDGNRGCRVCRQGFINGGLKCFEHLEDLPPILTGARFGGGFYFALIVATQVGGAVSEVVLIRKVQRQGRLPRRELFVLATALLIEVTRMLLVDVFLLQKYFDGAAYRVFRAPVRAPVRCSSSSWRGADGVDYCDDQSPRDDLTRYYIATRRDAFSSDTEVCSAFSATSALLDYGSSSSRWVFQFWSGGGHPRFSRLGWVLGGEFAFYYFFATFVNEVADNVFVVPTTSTAGWRCKVFSIALELFQLGALCPAAIFTHGSCLHYTNPLDVPLHWIRDTVVSFGYTIAVMPFFAIPLAFLGLVLLGTVLCLSGTAFQLITWPIARVLGGAVGARMDRCRAALRERLSGYLAVYRRSMTTLALTVMVLAFYPLLISGMFLGSLVVVGQASKPGGMETLTALVLMSDVLFKIVATLGSEAADYLLHLRVSRFVASTASRGALG